jgi:hypothetical protein
VAWAGALRFATPALGETRQSMAGPVGLCPISSGTVRTGETRQARLDEVQGVMAGHGTGPVRQECRGMAWQGS